MQISYLDGARLRRALLAACDHGRRQRAELNRINVFPVPDGDTGTNLTLTLNAIADHLRDSRQRELGAVAYEAAQGAVVGARGNCGMMLSHFLLGFAESVESRARIDAEEFGQALVAGAQRLQAALEQPVEGTILTVMRDAATAARHSQARDFVPLVAHIVDEKAIVNAIVGLHATGGSTNHTIHLIAIAKAAGITIDWHDFAELSTAVPLLARVYPNGFADVNHFHAAGGLGIVIRELLDAGLLHEDVRTILGHGMRRFTEEPFAENGHIEWRPVPETALDKEIIATVAEPFDHEGGLRVVEGDLGRAVIKVSAVKEEFHSITAPARVFASQDEFKNAFNKGELETDFVAVLPYQGPAAVGMPELHKLTPYLGVLQNRGHRVALLTDGRMSGASGKVLAAIQATPEAARGGLIGKLRDGDLITIDSTTGELSTTAADIAERETVADLSNTHAYGIGRELFAAFRERASCPEEGASFFSGRPQA